MPRHDDLTRVESDLIRHLADWWHAARGGQGLPDRADFDPANWKSTLPYILLAEGGGTPFRLRYRLVGTVVVEVAGWDFTGQYLDAMPGADSVEPWLDHYRTACNTRAPVYGTCAVRTVLGAPFAYTFGIFPLTLGGGEVRQFLGIEDFGALTPRVQSTLLNLSVARRDVPR